MLDAVAVFGSIGSRFGKIDGVLNVRRQRWLRTVDRLQKFGNIKCQLIDLIQIPFVLITIRQVTKVALPPRVLVFIEKLITQQSLELVRMLVSWNKRFDDFDAS